MQAFFENLIEKIALPDLLCHIDTQNPLQENIPEFLLLSGNASSYPCKDEEKRERTPLRLPVGISIKYLEKYLQTTIESYIITLRRETVKRLFIQTDVFSKAWEALGLGDNDLAELQALLLAHPDAGDTIVGTGGARKVRIPLTGRGKSGGGRVIYVDIVMKETIFLITAYAKNVQTDLNPEQKKAVQRLVKVIKEES